MRMRPAIDPQPMAMDPDGGFGHAILPTPRVPSRASKSVFPPKKVLRKTKIGKQALYVICVIFFIAVSIPRNLRDLLEETNNRNKIIRKNDDYLRCESHGRPFIESSMPLIYKAQKSTSLDLDHILPQILIEAETCAAAFYAFFQDKEQQQHGLFDSNSSLREDIANIFTTLGIIERRRNKDLRQSQLFFGKAVRISSNSREAKWHLSQLPAPTLTNNSSPEISRQSVLCCVAKNEESYIDEWTDYHLGIGFGKIIVYDNTDGNHLKQWGMRRGSSAVEVIHFPGPGRQEEAYLECAKRTLNGMYGNKTWAGFFDVDEFLVIKKHNSVDDFLKEHLSQGVLSINWAIFGPSGMTLYQPLPVTKRFVYREKDTNKHVKSLVRLGDMDIQRRSNAHFQKLKSGNQHDTNGKLFEGPFNENGPSDIAVIHHYLTKSFQEKVQKRVRGRASLKDWNPINQSSEYTEEKHNAMADFDKALANSDAIGGKNGEIFDDSAWTLLKKVRPKWALYDSFDNNGIL